jgi:hypothetical protein
VATDAAGPEVRQLQQQLAAAAEALRRAQLRLQDKAQERQLEAAKVGVEQYRAQTERMKLSAGQAPSSSPSSIR